MGSLFHLLHIMTATFSITHQIETNWKRNFWKTKFLNKQKIVLKQISSFFPPGGFFLWMKFLWCARRTSRVKRTLFTLGCLADPFVHARLPNVHITRMHFLFLPTNVIYVHAYFFLPFFRVPRQLFLHLT